MSAFIHDDGTYDAVNTTLTQNMESYVRYWQYEGSIAEFVTKLREWNYKSVNVRYRENTVPEPYQIRPGKNLSPIAFYKLLGSIDYQNCEIDSWTNSPEEITLVRLQLMCAERNIKKTGMDWDSLDWEIVRA